MQDGDKKLLKREITYQIGWKKGRMEIGDNGKVTGGRTDVLFNFAGWIHIMARTAWRAAPQLSENALSGLLWAVPPVAFLLIWLLVYLLGYSA
jgi:hypothetical protein